MQALEKWCFKALVRPKIYVMRRMLPRPLMWHAIEHKQNILTGHVSVLDVLLPILDIYLKYLKQRYNVKICWALSFCEINNEGDNMNNTYSDIPSYTVPKDPLPRNAPFIQFVKLGLKLPFGEMFDMGSVVVLEESSSLDVVVNEYDSDRRAISSFLNPFTSSPLTSAASNSSSSELDPPSTTTEEPPSASGPKDFKISQVEHPSLITGSDIKGGGERKGGLTPLIPPPQPPTPPTILELLSSEVSLRLPIASLQLTLSSNPSAKSSTTPSSTFTSDSFLLELCNLLNLVLGKTSEFDRTFHASHAASGIDNSSGPESPKLRQISSTSPSVPWIRKLLRSDRSNDWVWRAKESSNDDDDDEAEAS